MKPQIYPGCTAETLSSERRVRILEGAGDIFIAEGYEGASMSRIASQANVSKGTLYNYFPGKAELFAAFVRGRCETFAAYMFDSPPSGDLRADLTRIGRTMVAAMVSPNSAALFRVVVMESAKFPDLAMAFMQAGPNVMVSHMAGWLRKQQNAGILNVSDPEFAAEQFFSLTQARLVLRARVMPSYHITEDEIAHVVEGAVTLFLAAYGVVSTDSLS